MRAHTKSVVVLMLGIAMLVAGCGGAQPSETTAAQATSTTRRLEVVPAPDPATPEGVAVAALREIYTWYPVSEDQGASLSRARDWLGPSLLRVVDGPTAAADRPRTTLRWGEWASAGARVEAFAFASGERPPPGPDPNITQFKIGIEQTVVYPDGREEALAPATVIATVVRTPGGWRLDGFR
ncbi:hypothetical protein [Nocardia donostiensis]|uniref:Uncharacterized protein n=1 Tax=Nocardia donostiensis TaxID=1538463 RepID=A0A1W0B4X5_9NOCA|nr:hypothetical protein [Nocardia donostiensis]ONM50294.1 hypothetical protein B0T46_04325 [Nocardia donostiensis]OQS15955.1 hypothetical protein B0T36_08420 [Nocardia donostiensis]OQS17481.1 hypothetical protein B0T44_24635 [Nocardia donostiensis]